MDEALKERIRTALKEACAPDTAEVSLDDDMGWNRVGGTVISHRFDQMAPSHRQDLICKRLDAALDAGERTLVTFILTLTPAENEELGGAQAHAG